MFEKIFSIIREEGYSDGGVVVQVVILEQHNWPFENLFIGVFLSEISCKLCLFS